MSVQFGNFVIFQQHSAPAIRPVRRSRYCGESHVSCRMEAEAIDCGSKVVYVKSVDFRSLTEVV